MSIIFSGNPQHAEDIKLALSLETPFYIDEKVVIKNLGLFYEKLKVADEKLNGGMNIYFDSILKKIFFEARSEGNHSIHLDDINMTVELATSISGDGTDRKYVYEF